MSTKKLIYRVQEAMDTLGVSRSTIYRLVKRGDLHLIKIGSTNSSGITAASIEAVSGALQTPNSSAGQLGSQTGS